MNETYKVPDIQVFERFFSCPLNYNDRQGPTITVFARQLIPFSKIEVGGTLPIICYLQGGPGYECSASPPDNSSWVKFFLDKGYQVILLDQRGTGLSTAINWQSLQALPSNEHVVQHLKCFRADSIVMDCEYIREALTQGRTDTKWSLIGQSFGGFCATTYLSLFPDSLHRVYITGGLPPMVVNPDKVYEATFKKLTKRNLLYYEKYPGDIVR
ncbi:proline iminopeptidase, partial [Acrasis kona]